MNQPVPNPASSQRIRRRVVRSRQKSARRSGAVALVSSFRSGVSTRLDAHPQGTFSDARANLVIGVVEQSGLAELLEDKLRNHPGERCSYPPHLVLAAILLAIMAGKNAEFTDATAAINALPPGLRIKYGAHDKGGYFVSYPSFRTQYCRIAELLCNGFRDGEGNWWDTEVLVNHLLDSCPSPEAIVEAVAIDCMAVQSWARLSLRSKSRWKQTESGFTDNDDLGPGSRGLVQRKKRDRTVTITKSGLTQTISRDPGARLGYRTETIQQPGSTVLGVGVHAAVTVRSAEWKGDPDHLNLGPQVFPKITAAIIRPLSYDEGRAGVELMKIVKERHPECREVIADRGYTQAAYDVFRGPMHELGVRPTIAMRSDDYSRIETVRIPVPPEQPGGPPRYQEFYSTVGTLLDIATPKELLRNPEIARQGTDIRKEQEEFYGKRAAYVPPVHERLPGGAQRRRCPTHAGKLRPFDIELAATKDLLHLPALERIEGVDSCCVQEKVRVQPEQLGKLHQDIPFGTKAWGMSYGRREPIENRFSSLRTNLFRVDRAFCKTIDPAKYHLAFGLALVAVNLLNFELACSKDGNPIERWATIDVDPSTGEILAIPGGEASDEAGDRIDLAFGMTSGSRGVRGSGGARGEGATLDPAEPSAQSPP